MSPLGGLVVTGGPPSGEVGLGLPQPRASSTTAVFSVLRPHRPGTQCSSRQGSWEQPVAPAPGGGGRRVASTSQPCPGPGHHPAHSALRALSIGRLLLQRAQPSPQEQRGGWAGWRACSLHHLQGPLTPTFIPQSERSDLDFFSPKPGPGACSPTDGPLLQPSVAPAGSSQALVAPAGVPAPKASPFLFSTGLAPALAPKAEPIAPGHRGSALGDSTLHQLDVLDQLLEEAKV